MSIISGIVRDPSGKPIEQVRVYFTRSPVLLPDIAALTGQDGTFSLTAPRPGTYTLECAAEGFAPVDTQVIVTDDQREIHLDIQLKT